MALDLELRVAKLEAAEEIRHLKARYAEVCDTGYIPDRMVPLFTKEAVWSGGPRFGTHTGIDEIYHFFDEVRHQISWALHYMIAPAIEVADDTEHATGTWYLWQPCSFKEGDTEEAVWLTGTYADRYRREDGAWKFAEVNLNVLTISPFDEGWARKRFRGE
jgi:SnoaL-like domain